MKIGYARVSTRDQHPEAQNDALARRRVRPGIYIDKVTGKLARRPELDKALLVLREGDQLVVTKLDRLGRSLANLIDLSADLDAARRRPGRARPGHRHLHRCGPHVLPDPRRDRRVRACADVRAHQGRPGGREGARPDRRPEAQARPAQVKLARPMYDELGDDGKRRYTVRQIADEFGVTRPTIYRALEPARRAGTAAQAAAVQLGA